VTWSYSRSGTADQKESPKIELFGIIEAELLYVSDDLPSLN